MEYKSGMLTINYNRFKGLITFLSQEFYEITLNLKSKKGGMLYGR